MYAPQMNTLYSWTEAGHADTDHNMLKKKLKKKSMLSEMMTKHSTTNNFKYPCLGRVPLLPHYDARPDTVPHRTAVLHDVQRQTSQPTDLHHGHLAAPHTALSHIMPHVHHTCMTNQQAS